MVEGIVHGDFRLGNLLAAGARIAAVVDWEIWSVGDPRVDVGWFLLNADPATYRRLYRDFATQNPLRDQVPSSAGKLYEWDPLNSYIQEPPYFDRFGMRPERK